MIGTPIIFCLGDLTFYYFTVNCGQGNIMLAILLTSALAALAGYWASGTEQGEGLFILLFKGRKNYYYVRGDNPYGRPYKYQFKVVRTFLLFAATTLVAVLLSASISTFAVELTGGIILGLCIAALKKIDDFDNHTRHELPEA